MTKRLFFLIFLSLAALSTYAQDMRVKGMVYDTTGVKPLKDALAMAVRVKDSLLLGFIRTDEQGIFLLTGFKPDTFNLVIAHPNFDDKNYFIFGHEGNADITIPSIKMASKSQELEEVVIYAYKDPIYYKGDTLVYVADSFKVAENAVVEDLLKKLPGLKVDKDGKITSQGQEITKVLVDGDEFFGSDPTIATKNLGAKGVESVQVYEKENENGGDEKEKVLDLKLKENAKKGYFGKISGATDFAVTQKNKAFYEGELLLNKFNKTRKISVFSLTSNTPRSSFGWSDMNKFGLENETGGGNWWDRRGNNNSASGIPSTFKAGVYYSDKIGKYGKINMNYSFYHNEMDARSSSRSQYFLTDSSYFSKDSTRNFSKNQTHRININYTTKFDSLTSLQIKPSFSYDMSKTNSADINAYLGQDTVRSLGTEVYNGSNSEGISLDNKIKLTRKFKKPRREIELMHDLEYSNNKTNGKLLNYNLYDALPALNDTVDQSKLNNNDAITNRATLTYTEPISKLFKVETEYLFEKGNSNQNKETYNRVGNDYTDFVSSLSNKFEASRTQHRLGLRLLFEARKHTFSLGLRARNIDIQNHNLITDTVIRQNISNLLPIAEYTFKPRMGMRFNFNYRTTSDQPSISNLAPVPDNTNPNRIQAGNPNLKPNYNHSISMNFNAWSGLSGRYIWSGMYANIADNAFTTSTFNDNYGRTLSQTVNVDGNINSSVWAGAGFPFFNRKFEIAPNLNGSYNRMYNFVNGQKNNTTTLSAGGGLTLELNLDSLEISIGNAYTYNSPKSSLSVVSSKPYATQNYFANFKWTLPFKFKIIAEADYTLNNQLSAGYNLNILIINAEIQRNFLKNENLILSIRGNDLLNQNKNVSRTVSGNIITDNFTKIISRYFLLKLTFKFNNNKTKEEDLSGWH